MNCPTKPKGVSTQMKALDEYFLMVVFTLLLNGLYVLAIFIFNWTEKHGSEWVNKYPIKWLKTMHATVGKLRG